jgi:hypothetical protein
MSDFSYTLTWIPSHAENHAARLAVLYPLTGIGRGLEGEELQMKTLKAGRMLLKRWRVRLSMMHSAGWEQVANVRALQYARNCWPGGMFGVKEGIRGHSCRHLNLCPWCWARQVTRIFRILQAARGERLAKEEDTRNGSYNVRLFSMVHEERFDLGVDLKQRLTYNINLLRFMVENNPVSGSYYTVSLAPWLLYGQENEEKSITTKGWKLHAKVLGLLAAGARLESLPLLRKKSADQGWVLHGGVEGTNPTNDALRDHVARVCRYPATLLQARPDRVLEVLRARQKLRLTEFTGTLRGQKEAGAHNTNGSVDNVEV